MEVALTESDFSGPPPGIRGLPDGPGRGQGKVQSFDTKFGEKPSVRKVSHPEKKNYIRQFSSMKGTFENDKKHGGRAFDFRINLDLNPRKLDAGASLKSRKPSYVNSRLFQSVDPLVRSRNCLHRYNALKGIQKPINIHNEMLLKRITLKDREILKSQHDIIMHDANGLGNHEMLVVNRSVAFAKNSVRGDRSKIDKSNTIAVPPSQEKTIESTSDVKHWEHRFPGSPSPWTERPLPLTESPLPWTKSPLPPTESPLPWTERPLPWMDLGKNEIKLDDKVKYESKTEDKTSNRMTSDLSDHKEEDKTPNRMASDLFDHKKDDDKLIADNVIIYNVKNENKINNGEKKKENPYERSFVKSPRVLRIKRSASAEEGPVRSYVENPNNVTLPNNTNKPDTISSKSKISSDVKGPLSLTLLNKNGPVGNTPRDLTVPKAFTPTTESLEKKEKPASLSRFNVIAVYKPGTNNSSVHHRHVRDIHHAVVGLVILGVLLCVVISVVCTVNQNRFSSVQRVNSRTAIYTPHEYY